MKDKESVNKKITRVDDILKQIASLNKMIDLHKNQSNNKSMLAQYEFTEELNSILVDFRIQLPAA